MNEEAKARPVITRRRCKLSQLLAAEWTITKHTKRQRAALRESIERFGGTSPLVVRQVEPFDVDLQYYEVIDGNARLAVMREILGEKNPELDPEVTILDYGSLADDDARTLHLALNLPRGIVRPGPLADALEAVVPDGDNAKADELLAVLPLVDRTVDAAIAKFRRRAQRRVEHDADAPQGWINFRFRVDPEAAEVCDRALTSVEQTTQCERGVAFERICADFLAGPVVGRQA